MQTGIRIPDETKVFSFCRNQTIGVSIQSTLEFVCAWPMQKNARKDIFTRHVSTC